MGVKSSVIKSSKKAAKKAAQAAAALARGRTAGQKQSSSATKGTLEYTIGQAKVAGAGVLLTLAAVQAMSNSEKKKRLKAEQEKDTETARANALLLKNELLEMDKIVAKAIIDNPDKPESKLAPKKSKIPPSRPSPKMSKGGLIDMRKTGMFR